ncbi:MAG TPA: hypothetical protein VJM33_03195 [Microthrixaceae bacterium]|nr:hypothetical protein [Microthrixaceae bacterium]
MDNAGLIAVLGGVIAVFLVAVRRLPGRRRPGARTVGLTIDDVGVERTLADGRTERARWGAVVEVELVLTPVRTADGARAFVLLAEGDEVGCLVPLDVGWDRELLVELSRLPGFDLADFERRRTSTRTSRQVIWSRGSS